MSRYNPCSFAVHGVSGVSFSYVCPEAGAFTLKIECEDAPRHELTLFCDDPLVVATALRAAADMVVAALQAEPAAAPEQAVAP